MTPSPDDIKRLISMDDNGLLPCNSCQGKASFCSDEYITPHGRNFWKSEASCDDCENRAYGRSRISKSEAREEVVEAWNSRTYVLAIRYLLSIIETQGAALEKARAVTDTAWEGELLKCWDGFREAIFEYPDCDLPRMCFENYFDSVNEDIVDALTQSAPYRNTKEVI